MYAVLVRDETSGRSVVGYIGQSAGVHRRDPETGLPYARLAEHKDDKVWADLIVAPEVVLVWEAYGCTQAELDMQEIAAIRYGAFHPDGSWPAQRPLYNIEHNEDNPDRIPPWIAKERAAARGYRPPRPPRAVRRARTERTLTPAPALSWQATAAMCFVMVLAVAGVLRVVL